MVGLEATTADRHAGHCGSKTGTATNSAMLFGRSAHIAGGTGNVSIAQNVVQNAVCLYVIGAAGGNMGEMADYLLEQADADVDGVLEAPRKTGGSKRHIHQQRKVSTVQEHSCYCCQKFGTCGGDQWACSEFRRRTAKTVA